MYIFPDKNNGLLNQEVNLRLTQLTSQGLIKSEDEYKNIIQTTLNSIDKNLSRITDLKKYTVKTDDTISSKQLNNLFIDLQSDMRILHQEMADINRVINLTYETNKLFYRRLKNRLAVIWKEIELFRQQSFNIESSTYTFFESFSDSSEMYLVDLLVDTKTGILGITPAFINSFSDSSDVALVEMTLYPEPNKDGGLFDTTTAENTFSYNYTSANGDRMMLKNGLWKVQMLTAAVPELALDIFNVGTTTSYRGVIAQVDITFVGQKMINKIDIDPYGDFSTTILGMSYLPDETSGSWINVTDDSKNVISGSDVDWIVFKNFTPFSAKKLRLMVYQPNYQNINRLLNSVDSMVDSMVQGLVEKRFDKINYQYNGPEEFPQYNSFEDGDIYDEVMDVIENGGQIATLESKITDLLVPQPIAIQGDITNWKLFNMGAWEIDPQNVGYAPNAMGIYISHDPNDHTAGYKMTNGTPTYARLYTTETEDNTCSVEWSLLADVDGVNYVEIPIMSNTENTRTESVDTASYIPLQYAIKPYRTNINYNNLSSMIKLDFPIHPSYVSEITVLENGNSFIVYDLSYADFYNSTELYLPTANFNSNSSYVIKYTPAIIDTVKVWTLVPNITPSNGVIDFGSMCAFANSIAADNMINILQNFKAASNTPKPSNISIAGSYTKVFHLCTRTEFDAWFNKGQVNTFIDAAVESATDSSNQISWFVGGAPDYVYNSEVTKLTWLYKSNVPSPYSENTTDMYTWDNLISAVPQLTIKRIQY